MHGLLYEGWVCPDGVELQERSPGDADAIAGANAITRAVGEMDVTTGGKVFRFRTERRIPVRTEISNLENPLIISFVNATNDKALQAFMSRYGLVTNAWGFKNVPRFAEVGSHKVIDSQKFLRTVLEMTGGDDWKKQQRMPVLGISEPLSISPTIAPAGKDGTPALLLTLRSLYEFMIMEGMMVAEHGARFATCERCHSAFLTGPLTWRRSHAKFCSDKCRVAAMRARNAQREA